MASTATDGTRHGHRYTHCYCEENIYHLASTLFRDDATAFVIFISSADRQVPFWRQSPEDHGKVLVWDYHVVLVTFGPLAARSEAVQERGRVFDFDSDVPFPVSIWEYLPTVLRLHATTVAILPHRFRVVPVRQFLDTFASDRSHMLVDGEYVRPPPSWPPVRGPAAKSMMVLDDFVAMGIAGDDSLSAEEFLRFCIDQVTAPGSVDGDAVP